MRATPLCLAQQVQPTSTQLTQGTQGLRIGLLGGYFHDTPRRCAGGRASSGASLGR